MPPSYWTDHRIIVDLDSHAGMATALAVSLTAGIIVTGSHDRTVKVWDLQSGVPRRTIRLPSGDKNLGKIEGISLTPDGEICAVSGRITGIRSEELIYLLDPHTGKVIQTICGVSTYPARLDFRPTDGSSLISPGLMAGCSSTERILVLGRKWRIGPERSEASAVTSPSIAPDAS